jgi:FkbM family methyltransferase
MRWIKGFFHIITAPIVGKTWCQPFFETLHAFALAGMYVGRGGDALRSGEEHPIRFAKKRVKKKGAPAVFFDIGANTGRYTQLLSDELTGEHVEIHAFEPAEATFKKLKLAVGSLPHVSLHHIGLGDVDTKRTLFYSEVASGMASVYKRRLDHFHTDVHLSEEVQIRTLDAFCNEHKIEHITFLKIDAEGHDLAVLQGAHNLLAKGAIDMIQFEFSGCNIDSRTFFQDFCYLLIDHYDIYRVVNNGLYRVKEYKESREIFMTTNFFAVRKEATRAR